MLIYSEMLRLEIWWKQLLIKLKIQITVRRNNKKWKKTMIKSFGADNNWEVKQISPAFPCNLSNFPNGESIHMVKFALFTRM